MQIIARITGAGNKRPVIGQIYIFIVFISYRKIEINHKENILKQVKLVHCRQQFTVHLEASEVHTELLEVVVSCFSKYL